MLKNHKLNPLAIVTGGTKGIGRALVQRFLGEGFDVLTCSRNEKELAELKEESNREFPQAQLFVQMADLSVRSDLNALIDVIRAMDRPVEVLIHNTGVFVPGQVHNEEDGVLEKTIETNLYSAYHLTRGVIDGMIGRKKGHIFTMCSTASIMAYPNGGSYCISKFALYGMTKVLREEMKTHDVKVTAILPGATLTESWKGTTLPTERFMNARDIADVVFAAYCLPAGAVIEEILIRPQLGDLD